MDLMRLLAAGLGGILAGCAQLPNATITYYLPKSSTTISVTQTVACDASKNPNVTMMLNAKPTYSADYDAGGQPISIHLLDGALSDTDVTVTLTDDGRLKTINSSQTGQAEAVIKEVVTVAASAAALFTIQVGDKLPSWCSTKASAKPVTITYTATVNGKPFAYKDLIVSDDTPILQLAPDSSSQPVYDAIQKTSLGKGLMPVLVIHPSRILQPVSEKSQTDGIPVVLPIMHKVSLELFWGIDASGQPRHVDGQDLLLPAEGDNRTFTLHIPPSAWFGTQKFVLIATDSGAVTSIQYVKATGATSAFTAGQDILNPLKPESATDKASDIKAQADIIYQQQRLAACKASPSVDNCK